VAIGTPNQYLLKQLSFSLVCDWRSKMKKEIGNLEAIPAKRIFLSIIADYNLNKSLCELIDNALDNWYKNEKAKKLNVTIDIDLDQQTILIKDNSGGIKEIDLKSIISPGTTSNDPNSEIIGIFGVGTKRAVVALAKDVKIKTRHRDGKTFLIEFDDDWLKEDSDWNLPYYEIDPIEEFNTLIKLQSLRFKIDEEMLNHLKKHLSYTYGKLISKKRFQIYVNEEVISPLDFENLAFPPSYGPRELTSKILLPENKKVDVRILAGLSKESSAAGEYGVYFYCNGRLIARDVKNYNVGFGSGLAGKPHVNISLTRVIVFLEGSAGIMPWNSSKSDISYDHPVFIRLRPLLQELVKTYAKTSRALQGKWDEEVFKFDSGNYVKEQVDLLNIKKLHLAPVPKSRPQYTDILKDSNKKTTSDKPWVKGLLGGVIAVDAISKKKFLTILFCNFPTKLADRIPNEFIFNPPNIFSISREKIAIFNKTKIMSV